MLKNNSVLTEGALLLAFFTVLLLVAVYVPIIGIAASLILPLPLMLFSSKYSLRNSLFVFLGSLILGFIVGGPIALPIAFAVGSTALVMGWGIRNHWNKMRIFMAATFALLINIVLGFVSSIALLGVNMVEESLNESRDTYTSLFNGLGQETDQALKESMNDSIDLIQTLTPAMFLGIAAATALLFIWVNFPLLKKLGVTVPAFKPFRKWVLPKSILWYYLIVLIVPIFAQPEEGTYLFNAVMNVLYVLQTLLAVQGLSFLYFLGHHKGWSKGILILLTIISIPLLYLVRILGIIDLGFNLRQRLQRKS
ncbi:YybS family protein [Rossellomorea aquimaris]|uniref:YybS family protein n=1 Tax=Rossellomorea aquimaris TaxID=189382 RepID=UPI001CD26106|nr:YybS family protein [Rossellomorea aquimaris]MCA1054901.1 YybS family protein [Rossellomorea aquimaris]